MFAKKVGKIRYKHPAFGKLKRFGIGENKVDSTKLEEEVEDENLRVLNWAHELSEQKHSVPILRLRSEHPGLCLVKRNQIVDS